MLNISAKTAVDTLREIAVSWNARFTQDYGTAKLIMDNNVGKGDAYAYDIMPGLAVFCYDIHFKEDITIEKDEFVMNPVYFIYCLEGCYYHNFGDEEDKMQVSQMQNTIIKSTKNRTNIIEVSKNTHLKCSIILIMKDKLDLEPSSSRREFLKSTLNNILEIVDEDESYKYFGEINLDIAQYAKVLIKNKQTDAVGRLITESAVLRTLAAQLQSLNESKDKPELYPTLTATEIDAVLHLNAFISENMSSKITIQKLSKKSGLSPKKLQAGMRLLYGESINTFIKNVKLEHAKDLIENTDMTISEVSYSIGINSRSYFSKIFQERFGILPIDFSRRLMHGSHLFELSYRSDMVKDITKDDIKAIVEISRENNQQRNITGCLVTYEGMFFQFIEGSKVEVLNLYRKLLKDKRHHNIKLLWQGITLNRLFDDWNMALISENKELSLKVDGVLKNIKIKDDLAGNDSNRTMSGDLLWRRVRNLLKSNQS